jgi:hypothetical protein
MGSRLVAVRAKNENAKAFARSVLEFIGFSG